MAREFKMHRPAKARAAVTPLRTGPAQQVARKRLAPTAPAEAARPEEIGGPKGPEPTRYGDWERNGICYDF